MASQSSRVPRVSTTGSQNPPRSFGRWNLSDVGRDACDPMRRGKSPSQVSFDEGYLFVGVHYDASPSTRVELILAQLADERIAPEKK
jgi:hypothetical protein